MSGGGRGRFGPVALRLAGIAGWRLGWTADQFWQATPAEMDAVARAMLDIAGPDETAPTRGQIARLQEMFPDG